MKKVFLGLALGLLLSGIALFLIAPGIKQAAYDSGMAAGTKAGIAQGTTAGIAQGIAQVKAEQQQKHDEQVAAEKAAAEKAKAVAARKPKHVEKPQQNWHVIDGKIEAPIKDVVEKKEDKKDKDADKK
ncbi:MAG: hypothetical protein JWQ38_3555 [Flavipsychrobacter sp.]|nr:hypothetical protein [Flavipsychrobacter sp.]